MTETAKDRIENEIKSVEKRLHRGRNDGKTYNTGVKEGLMIARAHVIDSDSTDKISVEELQAIRIKELKDFNMKILQAELKNQELQKELDSCIQTLIEASAATTIMQDIVVGNLVDRKLADLAKTHKIAVDYIEKVTGKSIDVVLAENAALEALEGEDND